MVYTQGVGRVTSVRAEMKLLKGYYDLDDEGDDLTPRRDYATRYMLCDRRTGAVMFRYDLYESVRLTNPWVHTQLDMLWRGGDMRWLRNFMRVLARYRQRADESDVMYSKVMFVNGYELFGINVSPFAPSP